MGGVSPPSLQAMRKMLKVHTHTLTPGKVLDYGVSLGSLLDINIENLQEQSLTYAAESAAEHANDAQEHAESAAETETLKLATVAVISGSGFEKVFLGLGANSIISGGQTMNPSIENSWTPLKKLLSAEDYYPAKHSNVILSAQQVVDLTEKEVYVVPCKTLPQGISALVSLNYEADFQTNCEQMTCAAD